MTTHASHLTPAHAAAQIEVDQRWSALTDIEREAYRRELRVGVALSMMTGLAALAAFVVIVRDSNPNTLLLLATVIVGIVGPAQGRRIGLNRAAGVSPAVKLFMLAKQRREDLDQPSWN